MAPLAKVMLLEEDDEEYPASGPYSVILCIGEHDKKMSPPKVIRSRTFDKIDVSPEKGDPIKPNESLCNDATLTLCAHEDSVGQQQQQPPQQIAVDDCKAKRRSFVLDVTNVYQDQENLTTSTPVVRGARTWLASPQYDDEANKRDSLECDESLGILTPEQMIDVGALVASRTPSSENIRLLPHDNESSAVGEYSLGLIDLANVTMNLVPITNSRLEQTPSPEELPLDPTPILRDTKDEKAPNSFITSITSITSLDTGYQGDGEMSRPASRGADNSPLTRRPQPRQPQRRGGADPMTDSDFYTESDADNHEENPLRGDRKAQVIDGTLYGVDAQATADLYANNRENMDSSGIFTEDLSSSADNDVHEAFVQKHNLTNVSELKAEERMELSPSDSSTQTITDDSQTPHAPQMALEKTLTPCADVTIATGTNPTAGTGTNININNNKGLKMPKRNVASKVKQMMLEPHNKENNEKRAPVLTSTSTSSIAVPMGVKKIGHQPGRWDAVMNKISAPDAARKGFKEVKSKVFNGLNANRTAPTMTAGNNTLNNRRLTRGNVINVTLQQRASSISSSLSDLSGASRTSKISSAKKQREVLKVNQVLNGAKVQPKNGLNEVRNNTKNLLASKDIKDVKKKEIIINNKHTGRTPPKGATTAVAARAPLTQQRAIVKQPATAPPAPQTAPTPPPAPKLQLLPPTPPPKTTEALAVLVNHLVFNLEAFKNPSLRRDAERAKLEAEETRMAFDLLEASLEREKQRYADMVHDERAKYRSEIAQLIETQRDEMRAMMAQHKQALEQLEAELTQAHAADVQKLHGMHSASLDILREENDAIREQIDEKNDALRALEVTKCKAEKARKDQEAREAKLLEEVALLKEEKEALFATASTTTTTSTTNTTGGDTAFQEAQSLRAVLELKQSEIAELRKALVEVSHKAEQLPAVEERVALLAAKCEDLQHQLERKNELETSLYVENKKLQDSIKEEANQRQRLHQHNEELQWRLQQNKEVFRVLEGVDQSFTRSMVTTSSFNERHLQHHHHHQHNLSGGSAGSGVVRPASFERTVSFRERTTSASSRKSRCSIDDISPPSSPKVKGVVEKSDSVSYVLEMDESPEVVASRIVRRSFRNATPPKTTTTAVTATTAPAAIVTPTKSPANKRPRKSTSVSAVVKSGSKEFASEPTASSTPHHHHHHHRYRHHEDDVVVVRGSQSAAAAYCNGDFEDEDPFDFSLPALPSEIGRKHGATLPMPKHLAGEAMISGSSSEEDDESSSTASSSSGRL